MKLRKLKEKDAPFMLEWMHNKNITQWLNANFSQKSLEDCDFFITQCLFDESSLNLAIVDDTDEYVGTVSLKHIDKLEGTAEFAIILWIVK